MIGAGGVWHMHLIYICCHSDGSGYGLGEEGGAGRANDDMRTERRKSHTIGSLQRTISNSPR